MACLMVAAIICAACSSSPNAQPHLAAVTGTFVIVGGPNGIPKPTAGVVTFLSPAGMSTHVTVGSTGRFKVELAHGSYSVSGRSPEFGGGSYECTGGNVNVKQASPNQVQVVCPIP